jgi:hypothetical protein
MGVKVLKGPKKPWILENIPKLQSGEDVLLIGVIVNVAEEIGKKALGLKKGGLGGDALAGKQLRQVGILPKSARKALLLCAGLIGCALYEGLSGYFAFLGAGDNSIPNHMPFMIVDKLLHLVFCKDSGKCFG